MIDINGAMPARPTGWGRCPHALASFIALLSVCAATRAGVTPEVQRAARASTFEVVLEKPRRDPLTYEKPLPMELLPFKERNDPYIAVGTAFALGQNRFVTAAHVLAVLINHQFGAPAIRAGDGKVYAIESVIKLSVAEDYAVFTAKPDPNVPPLVIGKQGQIDSPVYSVGTALGDGVVTREGLLTSSTPEAMDGKWNWLRFSAAASPGNSGGPLLDAQGAVLGVVVAKSANENLNYALPIERVLVGTDGKALLYERSLTSLPFLRATRTFQLNDSFSLPLDWKSFDRTVQTVMNRQRDAARKELLDANAGSLFPKGPGTEAVLFDVPGMARHIDLISQRDDGHWDLTKPGFESTDLSGDGRIAIASAGNATLVRVRRSSEGADDAFYSDTEGLGRLLLRGIAVRHFIGSDGVRVTSLGRASSDTLQTDSCGRVWQVRIWAIPFENAYLVSYWLATPEGYVGIVQYASSDQAVAVEHELALKAPLVSVVYDGTLAQWQAFLRRKALLPEALKHVSLDSAPPWKLLSGSVQMSVPRSLMELDSHSRLVITMAYRPEGTAVRWDIGAIAWYRDSHEKNYAYLQRQARPPESAPLALRNRFDDMLKRNSPYDDQPVRTGSGTVGLASTIQVPGRTPGTASADVLYALTAQYDDIRPSLALLDAQGEALHSITILERGNGRETVMDERPSLSSPFDEAIKVLTQSVSGQDSLYGKDIRGRLLSQDVEQFVSNSLREQLRTPNRTDESTASRTRTESTNGIPQAVSERVSYLEQYWKIVPGLMHNRDLWESFLSHNGFPSTTAHSSAVQSAEAALLSELKESPPSTTWADKARSLHQAYVAERTELVHSVRETTLRSSRKRSSSCPDAQPPLAKGDRPAVYSTPQDAEVYYPTAVKRLLIEGTVILEVQISESGCPISSAVAGSSGMDELDDAAQRWLEAIVFKPAQRDGHAIASSARLPMRFKLKD